MPPPPATNSPPGDTVVLQPSPTVHAGSPTWVVASCSRVLLPWPCGSVRPNPTSWTVAPWGKLWVNVHAVPTLRGGTVDGCALLGEIDRPNNDFEGISCHFCHRAMVNPSPPPGEQGYYLENGQVWLDC